MVDWRKIHALASDYDGTLAAGSLGSELAERGRVPDIALDALRAFRQTGRRTILVTGRQIPLLLADFDRGIELFDLVVAENGALLYWPGSGLIRALAPPPPRALVHRLERRHVRPLEVGHVVVATVTPFDREVREVLRELALNWHVVMNRESVMILPPGVDKASGLACALHELGLDPSEVVAIGDAENDVDLLASAGTRAAVANAVPSLKAMADVVTEAPEGAGVAELIAMVLSSAAA